MRQCSGVSTSELIKTGIYSVKISPEENAEGDGKIDNLNIGSPFTHSAAGESGVEPNNQADPEGGGHEYEEYSDSVRLSTSFWKNLTMLKCCF